MKEQGIQKQPAFDKNNAAACANIKGFELKAPLVSVYLRKVNKKTWMVNVPSKTTVGSISNIVKEQLDIMVENQLLFLRGQKIYSFGDNLEKSLSFENRDIIHVHMVEKYQRKNITVIVEFYSADKVKTKQKTCFVDSDSSIQAAFQRVIAEEYEPISSYSFIQSGRKLDIQKTLKEEFITDESIIIVISNVDAKKSISVPVNKKMEKTFAELKKEQEPLPFSLNKLTKSVTISSTNFNFREQANFKKKQKISNLYKSSRLSSGMEVEWQSDSSSEHTRKQLLKRLARKKKIIEEQKISLQSSSSSSRASSEDSLKILTMKDKVNLKNEIKRLFHSECLQIESEIKKLQPPKIATDDFIQQIEEIELNENMQNFKQEPIGKSKIQFSLPPKGPCSLRQSVGKMKGSFVPLIPTHDFDFEDNDIEIEEAEEMDF